MAACSTHDGARDGARGVVKMDDSTSELPILDMKRARSALKIQTAFRGYRRHQKQQNTLTTIMSGVRFGDIVRLSSISKRCLNQDAKELGEAFRIDGTWRHALSDRQQRSSSRTAAYDRQEKGVQGWMGLEHDY